MESASLALWATQQVFRTPELLQLILLQTDLAALLTVAQRVCKNWHHTINSTPAIQRALYFLPEIRPEFVPEEEPLPPPRHSAERVTVPLEAQARSHLCPNPCLLLCFRRGFTRKAPLLSPGTSLGADVMGGSRLSSAL
ncbi:hypothetical protein GQ53DRAFT_755287 [Thozetella sp. PMI_491]|nr:hypothetical protein GQ53DRAFT_755287 [Thozetella sp. PMI_491]